MKRGTLYIGSLCCDVTHQMCVQTKMWIDPVKLENEIKARAGADGYLEVELVEGRYPNRYKITFARLDAQEKIEQVIGEIETDILRAQELTRLLDLTRSDDDQG